jgi:hypothetical protein
MMAAASTSEISVKSSQTTWCHNPEDSHLHTCCPENLKSHNILHAYVCGEPVPPMTQVLILLTVPKIMNTKYKLKLPRFNFLNIKTAKYLH